MEKQERPASFMDLRDRSMRDPQFKAIVDQMYALMIQSHIAPYELRDAAYMAGIMFAQRHFEPRAIMSRFPEEGPDFLISMGMVKP
jgi:hypothetical protein